VNRPWRVCLISSAHPWVNPRLVKEADLLASMGCEVTVVTKRVDAWSDERDAQLIAGKRWTANRINLLRRHPQGRWRWLTTAARAELAMYGYRASGIRRLGEEAYYRGFSDVLHAAEQTQANYFIAHTQGALPIAARAAGRAGVPYAFDCEDLLAEELSDGLRSRARRRAIVDIERAYLPGAAYVAATSHAMADYLAGEYGVRPVVVRNVFPLEELRGIAPPAERRREGRERVSGIVDFVWMSATIGFGRGLEDALHALAKLPATARLTVFGRMLPSFEGVFATLVERLDLGSRVVVRPIPPPDAVMSTVANFDVGLTLDLNDCVNRSLTICNKVFLYLQAGLAVAASDTPGQREVLESVPRAGILCPPGDADTLAARLAPLVDSRARLLDAQTAAWQAGAERYNWDRESETFLAALGRERLPRITALRAVEAPSTRSARSGQAVR
jgi:glycosyltransferase involved in cell wall biosynthesis